MRVFHEKKNWTRAFGKAGHSNFLGPASRNLWNDFENNLVIVYDDIKCCEGFLVQFILGQILDPVTIKAKDCTVVLHLLIHIQLQLLEILKYVTLLKSQIITYLTE